MAVDGWNYRANQNIMFNGVTAYLKGDLVPDANVQEHGYLTDGVVDRLDSAEEADVDTPADDVDSAPDVAPAPDPEDPTTPPDGGSNPDMAAGPSPEEQTAQPVAVTGDPTTADALTKTAASKK